MVMGKGGPCGGVRRWSARLLATRLLGAASAALACRRIGAGATTIAPWLGGQRRCEVPGSVGGW